MGGKWAVGGGVGVCMCVHVCNGRGPNGAGSAGLGLGSRLVCDGQGRGRLVPRRVVLDDVQGKVLLVGEGAAAFLALLGVVQGRTGLMQRVVPQMHGQGAAVGEPLVARGALEGLFGGGEKVLGGSLLEVENSPHIKIV